jgi:membrane protease YdiL (CAAX protease family)
LAAEGESADVVREQPDRRWWGIGDVLIAVVLFVLIGGLAASALPAIDGKADVNARAWSAVALISLPWLGLAGWPILATRLKGLGPVRDHHQRLTRRDAGMGATAAIVGFVAATIVAALQVKVTGQQISSSAGDAFDSVDTANSLPLLIFALMAGIGAPIVEEIAFRGLLYGALEKRGLRTSWCVVISAVTFVLFHLEPTRILLLLPIAVLLGTVRARTGSTGASIVTHMTYNLPAAIGLAISAFH